MMIFVFKGFCGISHNSVSLTVLQVVKRVHTVCSEVGTASAGKIQALAGQQFSCFHVLIFGNFSCLHFSFSFFHFLCVLIFLFFSFFHFFVSLFFLFCLAVINFPCFLFFFFFFSFSFVFGCVDVFAFFLYFMSSFFSCF